ncbi:MAG TPA: hypothetical protein DD490_35035 [Acidobacteria bacterium]|nr:hypothetical protein [Acidobacteriota bacterium]
MILPEGRFGRRIAPAGKLPGGPDPPETAPEARDHPERPLLERFVRGELSEPADPRNRAACRFIVRHLLAGCPLCTRITGRLWRLGDAGPLLD